MKDKRKEDYFSGYFRKEEKFYLEALHLNADLQAGVNFCYICRHFKPL